MARGRPRLSLLEAALLLCITGVVLAVFVPTFTQRVRTNKINEASELLHQMNARAASYYAISWKGGLTRCLPGQAGPTPETPTADAYQVDFFADTALGHATWQALDFQPAQPVRYSYRFSPNKVGCDLGLGGTSDQIVFSAEGDLDDDGVRSRFERVAIPQPDGTLRQGDALHVYQRVE